MSTTYLSVDPGATGSFCVLTIDDHCKPVIKFIDNKTPTLDIYNTLTDIHRQEFIQIAMIEDVHSLPIMTAKSNFIFGKNLGIVETILVLQEFGLDKVQPKVWQKYLGVKTIPKGTKRPPKELKKEVAMLCERLYPGCNIYGPKGGLLDGRADSLGICHYARLKYSNGL